MKYAGKFLSKDPDRLAELELAFNGVRRVHTMGGFYNAVSKEPTQKSSFAVPAPEEQMTADQIAKGKALAAAWKPKHGLRPGEKTGEGRQVGAEEKPRS